MAQMTKEAIAKMPRRTAADLFASVPDAHQLLKAVEVELDAEWWRGYFAAKDGTAEITPEG